MTRVSKRTGSYAAFISTLVALVIIGCGGGGGGGGNSTTSNPTTTATNTTGTPTTTANPTTGTTVTTAGSSAGSIPANAIIFTENVDVAATTANPDSSTNSLVALNPSTKAVSTVVANIPSTISPIAQDPNTGRYFFAAANAAGSYGIYSNTTPTTTTGATVVIAPTYSVVVSLVVTQDGKNIVFVAFDQTGNPYLYSASESGSGLVQLDTAASTAAVSPVDADTIVYSAFSGSTTQLLSRSLKAGATGKVAQITSDVAGQHDFPVYSRDATQIAYLFTEGGSGPTAGVVNVNVISGSSTISLPLTGNYTPISQAFSSDGKTLAIAGYSATNVSTNSGANPEILSQPVSASGAATVLLTTINSSVNGVTTQISPSNGIYWSTAGGRNTVGGSGYLGALIRRSLRSKAIHQLPVSRSVPAVRPR